MRFVFLFIFFSFNVFSQQHIQNDSVREKYIELGRKAYFKKDKEALYKSSQKLYRLYEKNKDSFSLAKFYHYKALFFRLQYLNDSAYYYYYYSKEISKKITDSIEVGRRLLSIAVMQRNAQDYVGSEISSVEALKYLDNFESYKYIQTLYNNLGLVSQELYQYKEALKYYIKASNINSSNKQKIEYLYIINNIGLLHQKQKQHPKAIEYFRKGLKFDSIKIKYPIQYAMLLENLASSNFLIGNKDSVLNQYKEVLEIRKRLNKYNEISTTYINISDYYKGLNESKKALYHAKQARKYAKQTHNNKRWLESLKLLSDLTTGQESKNYLKRYITLNDSLFQKERQLKNQFAKIRYETDKKEKENTVLKSENEKKQAEVLYYKQQQTIGWLLAGGSLLILILSITSFIQRRKKLVYQAQIQKAEVREKERQQIAKSLHDEVAGDLRLLHQKLAKTNLFEEAKKIESVKDNVRNLSHQLSSISFDKVSFKDQIINLVSDYFSTDFKIKIQGLKEHDWSTIDGSIKRLLYLGVRESIQNCLKYAQASKIDINFSIHKKTVFLNIADNGIGFNTKAIKKGIGLLNLEERVEELNGFMVIESEVGKGTQTKIQIPLNAQNNKNLIS